MGSLRVLAAMSASVIENSRVHAALASRLETARAAQDQQKEVEKVRTLAEVGGGIAREFNQIFAVILGKVQDGKIVQDGDFFDPLG